MTVEGKYPDALVIVLGDCNRANLSVALPKYRQQSKCATRGDRVLDHCYTPLSNAYHAVARAPLGNADHNCIHLIPKYKQRLKLAKPVVKTYKRWTDVAKEAAQARLENGGCDDNFEWAWEVAGGNLDTYTDIVTSFTGFIEDISVPSCSRVSYNNDKPWFSAKLKKLRKAKETSHKSGDKEQYKLAKYTFDKAVKEAKHRFSEKLQHQLADGNSSSVWNGLRKITNYKPKSPQLTEDKCLANDLNTFYCRHESPSQLPSSSSSSSPPTPSCPMPTTQPPSPNSIIPSPPPLLVSVREVHNLFSKLNPKKSAGPDFVSPSMLKFCADQLSPVFTDIFNTSLASGHVPACFKSSTIIPVPKKAKISSLNDYRPIALTSVVMKVCERLVLAHLKSITDPLLDPLQFAYRTNRSVDDAVNLALHYIHQHLDSPGTYVRILFVDYSSAFNTILPHNLVESLSQLQVPDTTCRWLLDFLTNRTQRVRLGKSFSSPRTTSIGSPQGCVLSPMLFSLYTNNCTSSHRSVKLLKFADDTTIIGLIPKGGDESAYRGEIVRLLAWSSQHNLELNALKTVEMVVDFRKITAPPLPITLHGSPVTIVDSFRFLGTVISRDLRWELNISALVKKAQQRLFFLRQLKKFSLPQPMLVLFYTAIIESIITCSITVWFPAAVAKDLARLRRVIRSAERLIGCSLPSLQTLHDSRASKRALKIMSDTTHPANSLFSPLPSGKRLRAISTRTARHKNSFFPTSVSLINKTKTMPSLLLPPPLHSAPPSP